MAAADSYDLIVVGCGAAGLPAALSYIAAAKEQGRKPRIAVLESAPAEQRGGATRWTTARFRAGEDFSLDPLFVAKVGKLSKGLADLDYCRVLEREVPETLRLLEAHGVKLLHFGPPVAMGVQHEITPDGGGKAIVEALASSLEKTGAAEILYRTEAVRLNLGAGGRVEGVVVRGEDGLLRTLHARAVTLACGGFEGNKEMLTRYLGANACDLPLLAPGLAFNQGAGITMAMEIGAGTSGQFDMLHTELVDRRTSKPDAYIYAHPFGIVVNEHAERFYDEGCGTFEEPFELIAFEVWRNQNQPAFFIAAQTITSHKGIMVLFDSDKPPLEAPTLPELAKLLGLDPDRLPRPPARAEAAT